MSNKNMNKIEINNKIKYYFNNFTFVNIVAEDAVGQWVGNEIGHGSNDIFILDKNKKITIPKIKRRVSGFDYQEIQKIEIKEYLTLEELSYVIKTKIEQGLSKKPVECDEIIAFYDLTNKLNFSEFEEFIKD